MRLDFSETHPFWLAQFGASHPMIPVTITGQQGRRADTVALVDTGADYCLLHARWIKKIGRNLKAGRPDLLYGIGEGAPPVQCYIHRVKLRIGHKGELRCDVRFSDEIGDEPTDQLIGRKVIFDRFRFGFRQRVQTLYMGVES